ncbi:hypothetical protein VPHD528_0120 [Vibrio phage D528]
MPTQVEIAQNVVRLLGEPNRISDDNKICLEYDDVDIYVHRGEKPHTTYHGYIRLTIIGRGREMERFLSQRALQHAWSIGQSHCFYPASIDTVEALKSFLER